VHLCTCFPVSESKLAFTLIDYLCCLSLFTSIGAASWEIRRSPRGAIRPHRKMFCARPLVWRIQPECELLGASIGRARPRVGSSGAAWAGIPRAGHPGIRRLSSGMWRSRRHIGNAKGITFVKDRMVTTSKIHATELGIPAIGIALLAPFMRRAATSRYAPYQLCHSSLSRGR
jgi:hypothetical protein